jgi:hypothetical protein
MHAALTLPLDVFNNFSRTDETSGIWTTGSSLSITAAWDFGQFLSSATSKK